MKCRLLVPQEHIGKPDSPVGTIIDDRDSWRLCGIHPTVILPLGGIASDLRTLDGFVAEPADQECLTIAVARGYVPADFVLKAIE